MGKWSKRWVLGLSVLFVCSGAFADEKIIYTSPVGDYWQVLEYNLSTDTHRQLTSSDFDKKTPVWSPDGKEILYRTGNGELFVLNLQTKQETQILKEVSYCVDPDWITDDDILLTRYRTDAKDDTDIWLYNKATKMTKVLVSKGSLQYQPDMHNNLLVYVSALNNKDHQLFIKDIKNGKVSRLSNFKEVYNHSPRFSPKGDLVAFVSNKEDDDYEIYTINVKNYKTERLTRHRGIDSAPKWINDQEIIYASYENGKFQINKIDIENKEITPLIVKDIDCMDPSFLKN